MLKGQYLQVYRSRVLCVDARVDAANSPLYFALASANGVHVQIDMTESDVKRLVEQLIAHLNEK